jgi:hypothetical protein
VQGKDGIWLYGKEKEVTHGMGQKFIEDAWVQL